MMTRRIDEQIIKKAIGKILCNGHCRDGCELCTYADELKKELKIK